MGNFKVKVNNEAESKEAQELFQKLVGKESGFITMDKSIRWVALYQGQVVQYEFLPSVELNEITLPELRAMVNDQYTEIEQVRQSAYDKQEGGSHYKKLAIQPMQYALANKLDYAQANVVKYVTRHADKNGKEDLLKAIHNIELMIEHYYSDS